MRIKDLLEAKSAPFPPGATETLPPSFTVPSLDKYYEYYRFLIAVAGMPEETQIPLNGPIGDGVYITPYSEVERKHSLDILKKMGRKVVPITRNPSMEPADSHSVSPVRPFIDPDGVR